METVILSTFYCDKIAWYKENDNTSRPDCFNDTLLISPKSFKRLLFICEKYGLDLGRFSP